MASVVAGVLSRVFGMSAYVVSACRVVDAGEIGLENMLMFGSDF
jgi:hypothetical protein